MKTRGIYSAAELARQTGVSEKTIRERVLKGLPVAERTIAPIERVLDTPPGWTAAALAGRVLPATDKDTERLREQMRMEDGELAERAAQSDPQRDAG